jgi:hypothetical protein
LTDPHHKHDEATAHSRQADAAEDDEAQRGAERLREAGAPSPTRKLLLQVLRGVVINPLFFSVLLGLAWNLFTIGRGVPPDLPWYLADTLELLATAFLPTTYFVGGSSMVGCFRKFSSLRHVEVPTLMIAFKSLLLPFLSYALVVMFNGTDDERDFGFMYGLLACAPSSLIILQKFGLPDPMLVAMNVALGIGRPFGFVLLWIYAAIATNAEDPASHLELVSIWSSLMQYLSIFGLGVTLAAACASHDFRQMLGPAHRLAQLMLLFSVAFILVGKDRIELLPKASFKAMSFSLVSILRWTADVYTLHLSLTDSGLSSKLGSIARCLRPYCCHPSHGEANLLEPGQPGGTSSACGRGRMPLLVSISAGLFATVPWVLRNLMESCHECACLLTRNVEERLNQTKIPSNVSLAALVSNVTCDYLFPSADFKESLGLPVLPLWLPYGADQALAYSLAYALLAALMSWSVMMVLWRGMCSGEGRTQDVGTPGPLGATGAEEDHLNGEASELHSPAAKEQEAAEEGEMPPPLGISHRLRLFSALVLLRWLGETSLTWSIAHFNPLAGVTLEQLYLLVFLQDGGGFIFYLLFGLHPVAQAAVRKSLARVRRAWIDPVIHYLEEHKESLGLVYFIALGTLVSLVMSILVRGVSGHGGLRAADAVVSSTVVAWTHSDKPPSPTLPPSSPLLDELWPSPAPSDVNETDVWA